MTTTLRPTEPLQHGADGSLSRRYNVCVNSRPVGAVHLATGSGEGRKAARIGELGIDPADRGRGRGAVAALAAEEVARGWGCTRIEVSVAADAQAGLRLASALGYVRRNRLMQKELDGNPPELPEGSRGRPMTGAEFTLWAERARIEYARDWISRGVPEAEALAESARDHATSLPDGLASEGAEFTVLEHGGTPVGMLWLGARDGWAFVHDVEADERHRGKGHGRSLMRLAEARALASGHSGIRLNVFAGNTPAERLYESLGYRTVTHHLYKGLL
ncbi:GNAT family N-acetyltransferase [Streptomyces fructofermentans]|uniref:GNAT family N-acetyltransferase n=1 Tax=Streptomyces fructofermentans TaxID=152141 RepID=UPI00378D2D79